jgi:GNAT superfamily N-acetyltransferase
LSREVDVVRTYLELRSPEQLRPVPGDATDSSVAFVHRPSVGVDRNAWSDERLAAHLARPEISVWECLVDGESAGYFELERRDDGSVEIAYFGLIETFVGKSIGKAMLTRAAREAWALGPTRVWLHTCTLDSPRALPNYQARGFVPYKTESYVAQVDD